MVDGVEDPIADTVSRVASQVLKFVQTYGFDSIVVAVLVPQSLKERDISELTSRTREILHSKVARVEMQVWRDAAVGKAEVFVFPQRESEVKKNDLDGELHSSDAFDADMGRRRCAGTRLGWL